MVGMQRGPVLAGDKAVVQNGRFTLDVYPRNGEGIPSGYYNVEVSSPLGDLQPDPVKAALGSDYEALTGPLVGKDELGLRTIHLTTKVQVGGPPNAGADKAARQQAYREHEQFSRRSCQSNPDAVERLTGKAMSPSERAASIQRCLREMAESRKELVREGLIEP